MARMTEREIYEFFARAPIDLVQGAMAAVAAGEDPFEFADEDDEWKR